MRVGLRCKSAKTSSCGLPIGKPEHGSIYQTDAPKGEVTHFTQNLNNVALASEGLFVGGVQDLLILGKKIALAFEDSESILSDQDESCQLFIAKLGISGSKSAPKSTAIL